MDRLLIRKIVTQTFKCCGCDEGDFKYGLRKGRMVKMHNESFVNVKRFKSNGCDEEELNFC